MKINTSAKEARSAGDCMYCGRSAILRRRPTRGGDRAVWWCDVCTRPAYGTESTERNLPPEKLAKLPTIPVPRDRLEPPDPPPPAPAQTDLVARYHDAGAAWEPSRDPLATDHDGGAELAEAKAAKLSKTQRAGRDALVRFVATIGTKEDLAKLLGCELVYVERMLEGEMAPWALAKVRITARMLTIGAHHDVNAIQAWKAG